MIKLSKYCLVIYLLLHSQYGISQGKWVKLFNGKDMTGWSVQCRANDKDKTFWVVEDGTILCNSIGKKDHQHVWLVTDGEYADFKLKLKFQAYKDSPGNCGVQIRCRYDDLPGNGGWMNGPQVDINPAKPMPWRTGLIYDETYEERRWIYPDLKNWNMPAEYEPRRYKIRYAEDNNEWNDLVIICKGMHIKTIVNGIVVSDWDGTGVLDNAFHQKHNVGKSGHIGLQLHDADQLKIRFKDIRIMELK